MKKADFPDTNREVYHDSISSLVNIFNPKLIVEIGVFEQKLSRHILSKHSNQIQGYWMVDIWRPISGWPRMESWGQADAIAFSAYQLKKEWGDKIEIIRLPSVKAASLFYDNSLDMIYIDGDHSEQAVKDDLEAWYPKLRWGGVFCGHDFQFPEVRKSVEAFARARDNDLEISFFPDDRWRDSHPEAWKESIWYWQKWN